MAYSKKRKYSESFNQLIQSNNNRKSKKRRLNTRDIMELNENEINNYFENVEKRTTLQCLIWIIGHWKQFKQIDNENNEYILFSYNCKKQLKCMLLDTDSESNKILKTYLFDDIITDKKKIIKLIIQTAVNCDNIHGIYFNEANVCINSLKDINGIDYISNKKDNCVLLSFSNNLKQIIECRQGENNNENNRRYFGFIVFEYLNFFDTDVNEIDTDLYDSYVLNFDSDDNNNHNNINNNNDIDTNKDKLLAIEYKCNKSNELWPNEDSSDFWISKDFIENNSQPLYFGE